MDSIISESDVEQKFILPILTSEMPNGLGYSISDIITKRNIRSFEIDKGTSKKVYFPDYLLIANGFPIVVIEAKKPEEDVYEGFREARLYAHELNAIYRTKINPCYYIIASNYKKTVVGYWDNENPVIEFESSDVTAAQKSYFNFLELLNKKNIFTKSIEVLESIRESTRIIKPIFLFKGRAHQNDLIGDNSFGSNIALDYQYIYNPETDEDREKIILNAYVPSRKRESHIDPIERIIKRANGLENDEITTIKDTENPTEINEVIRNVKHYKKAVCLLIGGVGSGKSTFVDYLKYKGLDPSIRKTVTWININMNNAPESSEHIYTWIIERLLDNIQSFFPEDDFNTVENIRKVFAVEIKDFEKGPIKLLEQSRYNEELYKYLMSILSDKPKYLNAIMRVYFSEKGITPVVVLDNCDKRSRDLQLLMFDVAYWLKTTYYCMVFLPLRNTTFDQYRKTPPLDTAIKDLTFQIDPPLLDRVLQSRYEYVLREVATRTNDFYYMTRNGMRILCKREDINSYLRAMLDAIFGNELTRRVFLGLASRDIRKGIEIFLDFCKSGYILEDTILRIRLGGGKHSIPVNAAMQILMKGTRKFYSDSPARVKSLFKMYQDDDFPDPFVRVAVLEWLNVHYSEKGPKGIWSYYSVNEICSSLKKYGHNEKRIKKEIEEMIISELIITESQQKHFPETNELIAITSNGIIHLDLLQNIYYLSFIAEDSYFENESIAQRIADNLLRKDCFPYINHQTVLENAKMIVDYLFNYSQRSNYLYNNYLSEESDHDYTAIGDIKAWIDKKVADDSSFIDYDELIRLYPSGLIIEGQIDNKTHYGYFFNLGINGVGYCALNNSNNYFEIGDLVKIKITRFNPEFKKFDVDILSEDQ
jgi:hypothetical protein